MKVAKFGGTSMASAEQLIKVANIVKADEDRKIIVVSAPGKRFKEDTKTTDLLIALGESCLKGENTDDKLMAIVDRYKEIAENLNLSNEIIDEISTNLHELIQADQTNIDRFMDGLKASGEDNSAKLFAFFLNSTGVAASYVNPKDAGIVVTDDPGNAQTLPETYENLKKLKGRNEVIVVPGFFGFSPEGNLVTFSRGGSDITGSIIAAGVDAELYENFTDVDSVFVANPNIVDDPKEIKELTYKEMRELSYAGFSVFHDEALIPAFRAGIPVCIKNTNNPSAPGTFIVAERDFSKDPVAGIASDSGFCSIYVSKYLMNREIGFGRRLLQILEDEGISYEHMPSGIDDTSIILRENQLCDEKEQRVLDRIKTELNVDTISIRHNQAMIMVVGEGMTSYVGISAKATAAFARAGVNIEMINQGSSEVSMMFAVAESDAPKAVVALYNEFFTEAANQEELPLVLR
ncbi:aspartate kinase [Schinkia azotoformans MEV2011]|uniref:Aspartokinase n=1 Tax=Schinkia azotoformans MEV2011 TaxID=1348973 RepID=A0A072NIQ1_SCHAZ|nr:aspartate kinase [Schinkia azotoformans]KEF37391.1 aspartate kinase [Schinkia azotoformans MEV2011]MEC1694613.1 aspartate kinase [Schinkia azotoformans]MEC1718375.1 aspartate kinase [Schinkia azotoformans]MEC1725674.1 aspartate kinase [Schinkia azotoformans]MEC1742540.1 aspartate kinase [Schinkia azotoformans]